MSPIEGDPHSILPNINITRRDIYTRWSTEPAESLGLPACEVTYKDVMEGLEQYVQGSAGTEFVVNTLCMAGDRHVGGRNLNVELLGINAGNFSGVVLLRHRKTHAALNIALDSGPRTAVVREDFAMLQTVHKIIPDNATPVYRMDEVPFGSISLPVSSSKGVRNFDEINWKGGYISYGSRALYVPEIIVLNGTSEGRSVRVADIDESLQIMTEMMRVHAKLFMESGEQIMLALRINNGDFVKLLDPGVPFDKSLQLITARANLLKPHIYTYAQMKGSNINTFGYYSIFAIPVKVSRAKKNEVYKGFEERTEFPAEASSRDFERLGAFPNTLTNRQKFILATILRMEYKIGYEREIQSFPPQAIFDGVNAQIKTYFSDDSSAEDACKEWWTGGSNSPFTALQALSELLMSPFNRWAVGQVTKPSWLPKEYVVRCKQLQGLIFSAYAS